MTEPAFVRLVETQAPISLAYIIRQSCHYWTAVIFDFYYRSIYKLMFSSHLMMSVWTMTNTLWGIKTHQFFGYNLKKSYPILIIFDTRI